jgi:hypothetical protein
MPLIREDSPWPLAAIHVGASMFIVALAATVFFDPSIWVLHAFQALIWSIPSCPRTRPGAAIKPRRSEWTDTARGAITRVVFAFRRNLTWNLRSALVASSAF